jgi:O6-methylguanine-DNA--protein-cysteine methyltransferase
MIKYLIICIACLIISILFFRNYNSGLGGPLDSFKKKLVYSLSILEFIAFIIFANKAYYFSDIQKSKQLTAELTKEYYQLDKWINTNKDFNDIKIKESQSKIRELLQQIDCGKNKEYDTYANIITNILSAFIAFVIAFTFKNKILG